MDWFDNANGELAKIDNELFHDCDKKSAVIFYPRSYMHPWAH